VRRGQRAAVNVAGVHHETLERGQELATAGHLRPSRLLTVQIRAVDELPRAIKNRSRVRVHVGTAELLASLVLLAAEAWHAGQSAWALLHLAAPGVTTWSQPFVIRSESPVQTIGGGIVLVPDAERLRRGELEPLAHLQQLVSEAATERADAALYFAGWRGWEPTDLARTAGIEAPADTATALRERGPLCEIVLSPTRSLRVHRQLLEQLQQRIATALEKLHQQYPLRISLDRHLVRARFPYVADPVFEFAVKGLRERGRIRLTDRGIALEGHGPKLSQNERKLLAQLIEDYRQAGFEPPPVKQVQQQAARNQAAVPQLLALAAANGDLVEVNSEYYLHADTDRTIRERLVAAFSGGTGLTVSQIREILNTSRKYAVPYCEYLDRSGFTRRDGDVRWLADRGVAPPGSDPGSAPTASV